MSASTTGSLTTTGSVTLSDKPPQDTHTLAQVSGTYGTVTFVFEGTPDGTNWSPLAASRRDTGALVTGSVAPTDNAELIYDLNTVGLTGVRLRATAVGSGTLAVALVSGSYVGLPAVNVYTGSTFGATTFSGAVTLADAVNIAADTTTGTKIGTATSQKLSFFNATPVVQPVGAGQATVASATGGESPTETEFNNLVTLTLAIRTALLNLGLIKGSA